jgi:NAD(P)-dependent dehydrogenase (short-subunit alcohol dehydrogenase family)
MRLWVLHLTSSWFPARTGGCHRSSPGAYATTMAALEAHSINLAAELADSGVTVNVYRPGSVEAAMRAWFGSHPAVQRGTNFADRLPVSYEQSALIGRAQSGQNLLARLASSGTGQIWTVADA